jgi:hypothetical protein
VLNIAIQVGTPAFRHAGLLLDVGESVDAGAFSLAHSAEQYGTDSPQMSAPQVSQRELGCTQTSQVGSPQGGSPEGAFAPKDSLFIRVMAPH